MDENLQDALETLSNETSQVYLHKMRENSHYNKIPVLDVLDSKNYHKECSFIEIHSLQPTHICPLSSSDISSLGSHSKSDDVKILQELQLNVDLENCRGNRIWIDAIFLHLHYLALCNFNSKTVEDDEG